MAAPLAPLLNRWSDDLIPTIPGRVVIPQQLRAVVIASLAVRSNRPVLAIVPGEREAEELVEDIALFHDDVLPLPAWETLPFEHISPNVGTMAKRAEARSRLQLGDAGLAVVGSVRAVAQRLSPSVPDPLVLRPGQSVVFDEVVARLAEAGYQRTDRVEARGEFAVRGGIIDVFPAQGDEPFRVDFWGDEIDEVRRFAVASQRSSETVDAAVFYPAREFRPQGVVRELAASLVRSEPWAAATWDRIAEGMTFPGLESWLPWLAPPANLLDETAALVVLFDPERASARGTELLEEEGDLARALASTWGSGAPTAGDHPALFLPIQSDRHGLRLLEAPATASRPGEERLEARSLEASPGDAESVSAAIVEWSGRGVDIIVAMDGEVAARRVAQVLAESGLDLPVVETLNGVRPAVMPTGIHHGFIFPALSAGVVGEREVAGRRRAHRRPHPARGEGTAVGYRDLQAGDFVVHHYHGVGRFEGLVHREMAGIERDYLLVEYAAEDKLYVPTDQLAAIRRYTGGESPRLSRLGGADWTATRNRVRRELVAVAETVVDLHRRRATAQGYSFSGDTPWQAEFEAAFPYEETPDQLSAIRQVKADMRSSRPMDRLIFGDVGFGKTEVALRAAFKAVQDGKQSALLVPTTLLAQQHFATFEERLSAYPVRVEMLSRFLTPKQQRAVIDGLSAGTVDVVVGTHRLLSEDVDFANLGLLVVDEEHRFGVAAKDKLKDLRSTVDVLTLTATPIPRTLEMALTGVREVSRIQTPPEDRHPILTYVGSYDDQAVSAAIRREMLREGQVFYVHNRIQSIDHAVTRLRQLVPDARYAVAHGRMSEGQLEQVMFDFWNREYDVLVATTIIESGLDLPQVNTLVVERAERLGLAQLYQLRGRVGRSNQRAYAYLFHAPHERLGEDSYRRLEAIGEFSDLGSGFELATRDLEIRGAGSILGEVQSGHIAAVGFELYAELVADAVDELTGVEQPREERTEVRIDLPVDAHLPVDYVSSESARLEGYRRLADAIEEKEIDDVAAEWRDRFGPLPEPAEVLLDVARLRVEAIRKGIDEIVQARGEVRFSPVGLKQSEEVRLQRVAPGSLLRGAVMYVPASHLADPASVTGFLRTMWP